MKTLTENIHDQCNKGRTFTPEEIEVIKQSKEYTNERGVRQCIIDEMLQDNCTVFVCPFCKKPDTIVSFIPIEGFSVSHVTKEGNDFSCGDVEDVYDTTGENTFVCSECKSRLEWNNSKHCFEPFKQPIKPTPNEFFE